MSSNYSGEHAPDAFQKAVERLNHHPYPPDVIKQLDMLRRQTPIELREEFDWFYEGAMASAETEEELSYLTGD